MKAAKPYYMKNRGDYSVMHYPEFIEEAIKVCKEIDANISLLSADTDKINCYVYSSTKLPEMRGASIILDDLNQLAN